MLAQTSYRGQPLGSGLCRPVIGPDTTLLAVDQPCLTQDTQVVADRRLALRKMLIDLADAQRRALLRKQVEHTQARWVSKRLQSLCQRIGLAESERWWGECSVARAARRFFFGGLLCRRLS